MAQILRCGETPQTFTEGPFIGVSLYPNGFRVEVELKGHHCTVLPDDSVYRYMKHRGIMLGWMGHDEIKRTVDHLNSMVVNRSITVDGRAWIVNRCGEDGGCGRRRENGT